MGLSHSWRNLLPPHALQSNYKKKAFSRGRRVFVQLSCWRMQLWPNLITAHFHFGTHAVHIPPTHMHTHTIFHWVTVILVIVFIGSLVCVPSIFTPAHLSLIIITLSMSGGSGFVRIMCTHRDTVRLGYLYQPLDVYISLTCLQKLQY